MGGMPMARPMGQLTSSRNSPRVLSRVEQSKGLATSAAEVHLHTWGTDMSANLSGRVLIASPYLTDGNFLRSVIFMIRHDVEGAFGLVVNRPTERRFRELIELPAGGSPRDDDQIYRGGPVEGPLLALHDLAGIGEPCGPYDPTGELITPSESMIHGTKVTIHDHPAESWGSMSLDLGNPPAWITGDDDHLRILLMRPDTRIRYVAHYSGWGPGQLDEEMRVGGWLGGEADPAIIFGDPEEAWELAVKQFGHEILEEIAPGMQPGDPTMN
jgi:putative transcriptional regulator